MIVGHCIVLPPTTDHAGQPATRLAHGVMPTAFKLNLDRRERATHPRSHRDSLECKSSGPCLAAQVREPQKVERLALASALSLPSSRAVAIELNQASLLGMTIQAEFTEPLTEHEVVRIADSNAIAYRMLRSPLVDPQIESVVQEYIRQQWR